MKICGKLSVKVRGRNEFGDKNNKGVGGRGGDVVRERRLSI